MSGQYADDSHARALVLWFYVAVLAFGCVIGLARVVAIVGLPVPLDPNEGWNAYHAAAAMTGGALYPGPESLFFNNYPPLSFYIVGALGTMIGDDIVAGRILSLLALLALAGGIVVALRRMYAGLAEAVFAALLFVAGLLVFTTYVGMDDPQLLAHAIAMLAFVLLLNTPRRTGAVIAAAAILTVAGFVKHNLFAMPLALLCWLMFYDRRSALRFAFSGIVFAIVGLLAFRTIYGLGLLGELVSPRLYSVADLVGGITGWLVWNGTALVATAMLVILRRDDEHAVLCAVYALVAIAAGAVFIGGAGVDVNAWFDAAIALALGAGLALDRLARGTVAVAALALVLALPLVVGLVRNPDIDWGDKDFWLHPLAEDAEVARGDVAFLKARGGPAMCEELSLCFRAGKPADVDVFNLGQAFATGARRDDMLVRLIAQHYFGVAQFDSLSDFALTARVRGAFAQYYRVARQDEYGVFLVPR